MNEVEIEIANELEGSCLTPAELLRRMDWVGIFQEYEIVKAANNQDIYQCYTCGWWNEENDIYSVEICTDCYNDE